ncbi:Lsr2 dimerization domain-containing protein [Pseudonocardia cypriaca]|uniref:Lsr2 protein n=1 Tax=Pseudonocardia cypriaca TaxID=882449 RepID=A0A543GG11_9PSEU|nr:histone-like nucleoid-structuring protein Lsr2 [Pseudonocardia cypriaca]TQM45020.1 Lsr2 protein [Pseudonocardia cypriaca]
MTRLVDDIDGSHAVTTVSFSLDGDSYEIDLSESHLSALQQALAPFVSAARVVPGERRAVRTAAQAPKEQVAVRREVIPAETTPARPATVAAPALDALPFRPPAPAATPARSKPAPLVADPFNPR